MEDLMHSVTDDAAHDGSYVSDYGRNPGQEDAYGIRQDGKKEVMAWGSQ